MNQIKMSIKKIQIFNTKRLVICFGLLIGSVYTPIHSKSITTSFYQANNYDELAQEIHILINEHRVSIGLNTLQLIPSLNTITYIHSSNMAKGKVKFGHVGYQQRMEQIIKSFPTMTKGAENVAYGQTDAKGVVKDWLNSSAHKKNIEGPYNKTGIGIEKSKSGILYFTQIFINTSEDSIQ